MGLREHPNAFVRTNIPATLADQTFSFEIGNVTATQPNQRAQVFRVPVTISVYFKNYRSESDLRGYAFRQAEEVYGRVLRPRQSLGPGGFRVQPTGLRMAPVGLENQASAIMSLDFDCTLYLNFDQQGE